MNINKKLILLTLVVAPFFIGGTALAEAESTAMDASSNTSTEIKTGDEGLTLQERLQKRKTAIQTRLDNVQKLRVQARCRAAQKVVGGVNNRLGNVKTRRDAAYDNTVHHLTELVTKLKAHEINTTDLEKQIAELQTKITTFKTDIAKYQEAAGDLADMDCTADPDGFKASLDQGRTLRAQVVTDAQAVHSYIQDPIKKTLQTIRAEVAAMKKES